MSALAGEHDVHVRCGLGLLRHVIEQADEPSDDPINDTLAHQMVVVSGAAHILERVLGLEFWLIKPPVAGSHVLVGDSLLVRHASGWRPVPHERFGYLGLSAGDVYVIADSLVSTLWGVTEVLDPSSGDTMFCSNAEEVDSAILGGVYLQSWLSYLPPKERGRTTEFFVAGSDLRLDHETGEWVPAEAGVDHLEVLELRTGRKLVTGTPDDVIEQVLAEVPPLDPSSFAEHLVQRVPRRRRPPRVAAS